MELTETERLMLVGKKEEIRKLTEELLDLTISRERNELEITKKITGILSLLSTIASYSKPKNYDLENITMMADMLDCTSMQLLFNVFCNTVNSITFDFTRKDLNNNSKNRPLHLQNKIDPTHLRCDNRNRKQSKKSLEKVILD